MEIQNINVMETTVKPFRLLSRNHLYMNMVMIYYSSMILIISSAI